MELLGRELAVLFLKDKGRVLAYSIHYEKEKAKRHLERIIRFHKLKGNITEDKRKEERLRREILKYIKKEKQSYFKKEDLRKYRGWEVYEYLISSGKKLHTYSEISKKTGLKIFELIRVLAHNPFLILIPCHRIIRKDGKISGYTPLGKEFKKDLLKLEGLI